MKITIVTDSPLSMNSFIFAVKGLGELCQEDLDAESIGAHIVYPAITLREALRLRLKNKPKSDPWLYFEDDTNTGLAIEGNTISIKLGKPVYNPRDIEGGGIAPKMVLEARLALGVVEVRVGVGKGLSGVLKDC